MQNELKQADRATVPLAERIERNIESIIAAHVTVWNVDLSDLLAKQREKIAELQVECKRKDAQYEALRYAYLRDNAKSPANACAPEQPAEEDGDGAGYDIASFEPDGCQSARNPAPRSASNFDPPLGEERDPARRSGAVGGAGPGPGPVRR